MKAVWYDKQGPARDVLVHGEMPTPEAGTGEVRVKLRASGINPADARRRSGEGYSKDFPRIIANSDGAGIVDQAGPGVAQSWVGKRVWLYNGQRFRAFGTAAEYIALPVDLVTELPPEVAFAAGATLGIPCMTAHHSVFLAGPVQGRVVLVTGGAGAVGHYAIQLARWAGASVIATVSSAEKAQEARTAGADHVIDYRTEDVPARILAITGGSGVDHVVEVDFGGNLPGNIKAIRMNGSIAIYASRGNANPAVPIGEMIRRNISMHLFSLPTIPIEARHRAQSDITQWLKTGERQLRVAARFPLEETAQAHEAVEAGDKRGTVVVEIGGPEH